MNRRATKNQLTIKEDGFLDSFLFLTKFTRIKQHLSWWTNLLSNASTYYLKQMKVCYNIHQIKHIQTPKICKKSTTTHSITVTNYESKLVKTPGFNIYFHKRLFDFERETPKQTGQLLLATRVRTWQGQHYSHVIARLECFWYFNLCLLYTSPSPRDRQKSRMPSSA